jgi:hypothetical protein
MPNTSFTLEINKLKYTFYTHTTNVPTEYELTILQQAVEAYTNVSEEHKEMWLDDVEQAVRDAYVAGWLAETNKV